MASSTLDGLVPAALSVKSTRIILDSLVVETDIGFHDFEIGRPQRLHISVELWLDRHEVPNGDDPVHAWNYDVLRQEVRRIASSQRWNLQETLIHAIYQRFAAAHGIAALRVRSTKPDIYPDADGVGVEIASFTGVAP